MKWLLSKRYRRLSALRELRRWRDRGVGQCFWSDMNSSPVGLELAKMSFELLAGRWWIQVDVIKDVIRVGARCGDHRVIISGQERLPIMLSWLFVKWYHYEGRRLRGNQL